MPAAPVAKTYADLKKRVALRVQACIDDTATGKTVADTTEPAATKIADALTDGVKEFLRAHRWSFTTRSIVVTLNSDGTGGLNIDSDPGRYLLPAWVQSLPKGTILWRGPDDEPGGQVRNRVFDDVATLQYSDPQHTGAPEFIGAEFNPGLAPGISRTGGVEMLVWPKPDQNYKVRIRCRIGAVPFVAEHQVGFWPEIHDETVVAMAVREYFKHDREPNDPALAMAAADVAEAMAKSIEIDDEDFREQELGSPGETQEVSWGRAFTLTDVESGVVLLTGRSF